MTGSPVSAMTLAELGIECWKLLRALDRLSETVEPQARARVAAQARYAAGRLDELTGRAGLRLLDFAGQPFEAGLPVTALNADDFPGVEELLVESTIEPAAVVGTTVILVGKVIVRRPDEVLQGS